ncbi:MAG: mevalonate kinase [Chloroflexi bacterium]|nr:mevalonate kinase [Chloroflexota bacterium]
MTTASAPGKIILFGEHAVVYNRPAIAVPVAQVQAIVTIEPHARGSIIHALDTGRLIDYAQADPNDPLAAIVRVTLAHFGLPAPDCAVTIRSTIPIASGLGSGAAVSVAIVRALAAWLDQPIDDETVSRLSYEVEKLHHGTPSGIDNTVIAYSRPVYFVRGQMIETFEVKRPFTVAIGNTGIASPTKIAVGDVRKGREVDPVRYEAWFDQIGAIAREARTAIEHGEIDRLGPLMDQNQSLLQNIGVSSVELERLIAAAKAAGAAGAKLVGGGRGGNMIALIDEANREAVVAALYAAGATNVIVTKIGDWSTGNRSTSQPVDQSTDHQFTNLP